MNLTRVGGLGVAMAASLATIAGMLAPAVAQASASGGGPSPAVTHYTGTSGVARLVPRHKPAVGAPSPWTFAPSNELTRVAPLSRLHLPAAAHRSSAPSLRWPLRCRSPLRSSARSRVDQLTIAVTEFVVWGRRCTVGTSFGRRLGRRTAQAPTALRASSERRRTNESGALR